MTTATRRIPLVAVIGRPNVGKSTLFNRLVGQPVAIVHDQPGVTRDPLYRPVEWQERVFELVDTGGLVPEPQAPLEAAVVHQAKAALESADVILLVVDVVDGPSPLDQEVAAIVRHAQKPVLLVVNKVDRLPEDPSYLEFYRLGLGEPLPVSALQGRGTGDLLDRLVALLPTNQVVETPAEDELRLAVVGRPNVGKSSFINRLLGEERLIVSPLPGTTRDAIDTPLQMSGKRILLIDTAGLKRQARIGPGVEYYASLRTIKSLGRCDVALLLIEGPEGLVHQDLRIAAQALELGKGLVLGVNKWDLVEKDSQTADQYLQALRQAAPFLLFVPVTTLSALTGHRVVRALELSLQVAEGRRQRIPTSALNQLLTRVVKRRQPPAWRGTEVRLLYATQVGQAPPAIVIFTNRPEGITAGYQRYLEHALREVYPFTGVPVRLIFRQRTRPPKVQPQHTSGRGRARPPKVPGRRRTRKDTTKPPRGTRV